MSSSWMVQSFFFDWNDPSLPTPVPITAQCETLNIKWQRGQASGPDPVAPYWLQIYSSNYVVPFSVYAGTGLSTEFTVPFAPGSQYQICMFDSKGNTGGCQATYTVYDSNPSTTASCTNVTFPPALSVEPSSSQYGWPAQCADYVLKPSGVPPYNISFSPALHPPMNFTNVGAGDFHWPLQLGWGAPFWVSVSDSTGAVWSNGPLHAGESADTSCLNLSPKKSVPVGTTVGLAVGALILGAVLAILIHYLWLRRVRAFSFGMKRMTAVHPYTTDGPALAVTPIVNDSPGEESAFRRPPTSTSQYMPVATEDNSQPSGRYTPSTSYFNPYENYGAASTHHGPTSQYPSQLQSRSSTYSEQVGLAVHDPSRPTSGSMGRPAPSSSASYEMPDLKSNSSGPGGWAVRNSSGAAPRVKTDLERPSGAGMNTSPTSPSHPQMNQVYVVHNDGGRAPVTIYTSDGSQVVELPPQYAGMSQPAGSSSERRPPEGEPAPTSPPRIIPPPGKTDSIGPVRRDRDAL